jgi:hypothetical protein
LVPRLSCFLYAFNILPPPWWHRSSAVLPAVLLLLWALSLLLSAIYIFCFIMFFGF